MATTTTARASATAGSGGGTAAPAFAPSRPRPPRRPTAGAAPTTRSCPAAVSSRPHPAPAAVGSPTSRGSLARQQRGSQGRARKRLGLLSVWSRNLAGSTGVGPARLLRRTRWDRRGRGWSVPSKTGACGLRLSTGRSALIAAARSSRNCDDVARLSGPAAAHCARPTGGAHRSPDVSAFRIKKKSLAFAGAPYPSARRALLADRPRCRPRRALPPRPQHPPQHAPWPCVPPDRPIQRARHAIRGSTASMFMASALGRTRPRAPRWASAGRGC